MEIVLLFNKFTCLCNFLYIDSVLIKLYLNPFMTQSLQA